MKTMQLKTKPKGPIVIPLLSIHAVTYLYACSAAFRILSFKWPRFRILTMSTYFSPKKKKQKSVKLGLFDGHRIQSSLPIYAILHDKFP